MLVGLGGLQAGDLAVLLVLDALVDEEGGVTAVVQDHVRAAGGAVRPGQRLLGAPPVLLQGLALPGEDRDALRVVRRAVRADGDGGGRVVLGGEDVARGPADPGAEGDQGLDEYGGLHGHVQGAGDAGAGEGLGLGVFLADRHQARHLVLGEGDLLAAELGQREVGDLEVLSVVDSRHCELLLGIGARWVRLVCAAADTGVPEKRTQGCPRTRSAVRRRPSLPRPVRMGTARPPSAATSGSVPSYTGRPGRPQSASGRFEEPGRRFRGAGWGQERGRQGCGIRGTGAHNPVWTGTLASSGRGRGDAGCRGTGAVRFRSRGVRDGASCDEGVRRST